MMNNEIDNTRCDLFRLLHKLPVQEVVVINATQDEVLAVIHSSEIARLAAMLGPAANQSTNEIVP